MKNLLLLPLRFCARCLYKFFDLLISAMRMSALNWMKIFRRAADAGLDVKDAGRQHASQLRKRIQPAKQDKE